MAIKDYTGGYNINLDKVSEIFDYLNSNKNIEFIRSDEISEKINIDKYHAGGCLGWLCRLKYLEYFSGKARKRTYTVNRDKKREVCRSTCNE